MEGKITEEAKERGRGVKHKKESKVAKRTGDIKSWQRGKIERGMEVVCLSLRPSKQDWVHTHVWLLSSFIRQYCLCSEAYG